MLLPFVIIFTANISPDLFVAFLIIEVEPSPIISSTIV